MGRKIEKFQATETVKIEVVAKGQPVFSSTLYKSQIHETAPKGTVVVSVKAKSANEGFIVYVIENGNEKVGVFFWK